MSVAESVYLYLAQKPALISLLGKDTENAPYLYQDNLALEQSYLENSQDCAAVISHVGEWDVRSPFSTFEYPRIVVQVWADPDRAANHDPVSTVSARDKALAVSRQLTLALHRTERFDERWGQLRVLTTVQTRGPEIADLSDGNGMVMATSYFGLITSP
jgi:hypothetical protein